MNIDDHLGMAEACRESGLTRHQVYYLERKGFLGEIRRDGRTNGGKNRRFSPEQRAVLRRYQPLRASGIDVDVAAAIAAEGISGIRSVPTERLYRLAAQSARDVEAKLRSGLILQEVLLSRLATLNAKPTLPVAGALRAPAGSAAAASRPGP